MNKLQDTQYRREAAMSNLAEVIPHTKCYKDMDFEELLEIMKQPVRSISTCVSKEQLKTYCIQLLTHNLTLQAEVKRLKNDET